MGARTLEVRLSARLLVLAAVVLTAVGITTALVTDRALAVADNQRARDEAAGARDSLAVELSEGDSREQASREVVAAANGEGVRLAIQFEGGALYSAGPGNLPTLAAGQCANVDDEGGHPWRACCVAGVDPRWSPPFPSSSTARWSLRSGVPWRCWWPLPRCCSGGGSVAP